MAEILRFSQKELTKLFESGDAKIVPALPEALKKIAEEFKNSIHTPQFYREIFQRIWNERAGKLSENTIPHNCVYECTYTQEEIDQIEKEGRRLGFLPISLSSQKDRRLLYNLWPEMNDIVGTSVENKSYRNGWFDYDTDIDPPNLGITEDMLQEIAGNQNRFGMNLNEYIIASQDNKLFTGTYLDQEMNWTRLMGSYRKNLTVGACFTTNGYLYINPITHSEASAATLGGRLVGLPKILTSS